jgi:hypothetical protein
MIELAHLLDQHLAAHNLRPCWPDGTGAIAFETPDLVAFCAYRNSQGGLGQFANPGYLHEAQWAAALEDEVASEKGVGLLMSWKTEGVAWRLEFDRETGLVTLTREVSQMPRDVHEMTAEVSVMREAFATWQAKLRADPPEWRPQGETVPDGYVRA